MLAMGRCYRLLSVVLLFLPIAEGLQPSFLKSFLSKQTLFASPEKNDDGTAKVKSKEVEILENAVKMFSDAVETTKKSWFDKGWQVRKRAGNWLPELVAQPGSPWGQDLLPSGDGGPSAGDADEERRQWLATASSGARALTVPSSDSTGREVAVAKEFSRFLAKPEVMGTYSRTDKGEIVFADEEALSTAVAAFALELSRELAAAARALARFVDDLEGELAAADESTVRLRAQLCEAEEESERRSASAASEGAMVERFQTEIEALSLEAEVAKDSALDFERKAEEASLAVETLEQNALSSSAALSEARATALAIEERLVGAEQAARQVGEELKTASAQSEAAERRAKAASVEKDAVEDVVSAMEKRALAAEAAAQLSATRLESALTESRDAQKKLETALRNMEEPEPDVASEVTSAAAELKKRTTKSLALMRKTELIAELRQCGLDPTGLKVPQLRAELRSRRRKAKL